MVISIVIVLMGAIALFSLPVEQYPDIAPPTISVWASYPGANAETVQKAVIMPLEEAINGVEHMTYMTSTASNSGDASITIYFEQGSNADMAAVNVQNRVSTALSLLPAEVTKSGVSTEKQQNSELKTFALYSPGGRYDGTFINNYMDINVEPRIKRIGGVGKIQNYGATYSMRIWMNPDKMMQHELVPSDIETALAQQNLEAATGAFGENSGAAWQYTMKFRGRYSTPEEFGNIVLKALPDGNVLRLKDVAEIELGDDAYNFVSDLNGLPASVSTVYQTAGSNASEIINEIDAALDDLSRDLPEGMEFVTLSDTNRFLYASIFAVLRTLLEAILLVVLVVYVFLQDLKSTLIPTISIFVSIIGTFAVMSVAGFSVNLLTLFALVLAIGTVVDDAIIVVEAVQARFDAGYRSPYLATEDAMNNVSSAILTSTLIFMAVFFPVSMIGGTSGEFYKQFGMTMAIAVGISALNAFTLSPALCALVLRPYTDGSGNMKNNFAARFRIAFNTGFSVVTGRYLRILKFFMRRKWMMWLMLAVSAVLLVALMHTVKTGLIPEEDTGTVIVSLDARPGTALPKTYGIMSEIEKRVCAIPGVQYASGVAGYSFTGSGPSMGLFFVSLDDWKDRDLSSFEICDRINEAVASIPDINVFVTTPPMIPGYGMSNDIELYLQDRNGGSLDRFKSVAEGFVEALSGCPEISSAYSAFDNRYPQFQVGVDDAQCVRAGISTDEVIGTLAGYYGGSYASNFNRFSKLYKVQVQARPEFRMTPESLDRMYVRTPGGMAPLSQFVKLIRTEGPQDLTSFNLYGAISISVSPAEGYSTGDAMNAISRTASGNLPSGYGFEYGGVSREEAASTGNAALIFVICIVLVYLILSALYESFLVPAAVILAIPAGLAGSFAFAAVLDLENNIYLQTGLIMLIGLLAKTAILQTEYAVQRRKEGLSLTMSAFSAARERFRPILMTVVSMIFGLIPLMVASGVGANGCRSLASGVVGGMIAGSVALLLFVPVLFIVFQYLQERLGVSRRSS